MEDGLNKKQNVFTAAVVKTGQSDCLLYFLRNHPLHRKARLDAFPVFPIFLHILTLTHNALPKLPRLFVISSLNKLNNLKNPLRYPLENVQSHL